MSGRAALAVVALLAVGPNAARAQDSAAVALHSLIAGTTAPLARWPDFSRHAESVARLYAAHAGVPLWLEHGRITGPALAALAALRGADAHGLDPRDYDGPTLDSLATRLAPDTPAADLARFDLLLTVDVLRLLDDLRWGRLAYGPYAGARRLADRGDLAAGLSEAIRADTVAGLIAGSAPALTQYHNLQRLLAVYRRLAADSTLAPIEATGPIRPGDRLPQATALRRRLRAVGDLDPEAGDSGALYAPGDVAAVRQFQLRHGLIPDGVLGEATLSALNSPYSRRVRQIELALERLRWLPPLPGQRFLVVNIPAFALFAFDSTGGPGRPSLGIKVVVGKAVDSRTPMLYASMRALEFRPFWNVPRSILVKEILPELRRHPGYLRGHDMELVGPGNRPLGDGVNADVLRRLARGELRVRQRPGPRNPLGLVKFDVPNAASVYLHGTADPRLFTRERRDFSHGCIRVEDPVGLAEWVLHGQPGWSRAAIERAMAGPAPRRVPLTRPIPVAVYYTTAVALPDGSVRFYPDLYGVDQVLDRALRRAPLAS